MAIWLKRSPPPPVQADRHRQPRRPILLVSARFKPQLQVKLVALHQQMHSRRLAGNPSPNAINSGQSFSNVNGFTAGLLSVALGSMGAGGTGGSFAYHRASISRSTQSAGLFWLICWATVRLGRVLTVRRSESLRMAVFSIVTPSMISLRHRRSSQTTYSFFQ